MFGLGPTEMIVVLVVLLLLFGSRLPSVMRSLGKSATEFKRGMNDMTDDITSMPEPDKKVSASKVKDIDNADLGNEENGDTTT